MRLVIIGNGVAGVTTARYVTDRDPSIETAIYSDESYPYYPRPRLIDLIAGHTSPEAISFYPQDWYTKRGIDLHLNRCAVALDPAGHRVTMAKRASLTSCSQPAGTRLGSADPRRRPGRRVHPAVDGGRHRHSRACAHEQQPWWSSGGLLGLDLAHAIHAQQERVTVVELLPRLLPRQLDEEGAAVLRPPSSRAACTSSPARRVPSLRERTRSSASTSRAVR